MTNNINIEAGRRMSKIRIKNFGPIQAGYHDDDGWIEVRKVTVFIGDQGSGKSTVAKLISTFSWIEKALVRGDFKEKEIKRKNQLKKHLSYQNIANYFKDDTELEYCGDAYYISHLQGVTEVERNELNGYLFPKIMYVPAERNFASAVDKPASLKKLPNTLYAFLDELESAKEAIKEKEGIVLPIADAKFEYHKASKISYIAGRDYRLRLSEASSGFQSLVPLFLVTKHLAGAIYEEENLGKKNLSVEEGNRIRKEIEKILSNPNLSEDVKKASLEFLSSKFRYSRFINIVEEPEQNLFPASQRKILNALLAYNNLKDENKLIITTHSPYIVNFMSLAIQAHNLKKKIGSIAKAPQLLAKLNEIIPEAASTPPEQVAIYELDETNGSISRLSTFEGIPSDRNLLNMLLREGNQLFDSLLEIEEELQA